MALSVWQKFVTDGSGNPISGASVEVRDPGTTTKNAIYKDRAGTTQWASNVATTDADGFVQLYVAAGRYDIFVDDGAGHTATYEDVYIGSAIMLRDVGKTIGDIPEYEDDGAGNPVLDHPNFPYVNGEILKPEWLLVGEVVLNNEGLDHTFTGLDGDSDVEYKVTYNGDVPNGSGDYPTGAAIIVRPFGATSTYPGETTHRFYHSGSVTHSATNYTFSGLELCRKDWDGGIAMAEGFLHAKQNAIGRMWMRRHVLKDRNSNNRIHYNSVASYNGNFTTNMTSLQVLWTGGTSETMTGVLRLYRKVP